MTDGTEKTLLLIDGHSMAFRAFYALPAENFSTTGGQHTNAVYGFLSMFVNILTSEEPTHLAVAFDVARETFRNELFPEYKAQRAPTPEEFKGQVEILKDILHAMGVTTVEKPGYEADDVIATLATAATKQGMKTLIVTGDRDSFQLVNDDVTVLYPTRGVSTLNRMTPAAVEKKYDLTPTQYPDFAALRGDPSDNLPKIPGVGEKTATKWIKKYETLGNLLAHVDEIKGKVGDALRERVDQVAMNRKLTEMVKDLPLEVSPLQLERGDADVTEISNRFDELQFGVNLRERVLQALGEDSPEPEATVNAPEVTEASEALPEWLTRNRDAGIAMAVDGDPKPGEGDCTFAVLVATDYTSQTVDFSALEGKERDAFAKWVSSDDPKFLHFAKRTYHKLISRGFTLGGIAHDTAIAGYLLRPGQRTYEIADVYQRHLQKQLPQSDGQLSLLDDSPSEPLLIEAMAVLELVPRLTDELSDIESLELYTDLEIPLITILAAMEDTGIAVDTHTLEEQLDGFVDLVAQEEEAARDLAGDPSLNLSSPKQLQVVLFETFDLPKTKKTKTGYSTAAKEIEALAKKTDHPFLQHLLAHREYSKMKSTLEGLIRSVGGDGRIHTTFKQTVASTGRLSSTDPNLQNIPVRTDAGKKIRSAFVVGEGFETLLTADYSQIEMRVMAHVSEDAGLIQAYKDGEDLHNYVGSKVFDVGIDEVTPELRRRVKAMSYGLAYGLSSYGLAAQLDIPQGEAKSIMDSYFERFGGVKNYLRSVVDEARKDGYTSTLFGRRRYLPELTSTNRIARENAERAALNAPIQGTAADIIKVAMVRVNRRLDSLKSRVLLQVHDELVLEVAPGELEEVSRIVSEEMDGAISLRVPLEVSTGHGTNWDEAAH